MNKERNVMTEASEEASSQENAPKPEEAADAGRRTGKPCCSAADGRTTADGKQKHRNDAEYRSLMNRLNRIEGQVRGVKAMLEQDRYCVDILTQVSAIQSALNSFNKILLSSHIRSCVTEEIQAGNEEVIDELCETMKKLMK